MPVQKKYKNLLKAPRIFLFGQSRAEKLQNSLSEII